MAEISSEVRSSGLVVISARGPLDLMAAPALREELTAHVHNGNKRLVIDLSEVESMDSTALGALVFALKAARKNGGDLRIAGPNERVVTLLKLTKLADLLKVTDSIDEPFP